MFMNRFLIKKAALLASPEGTITELAKIIGYSAVGLTYPYHNHENRGVISERLAAKLQNACGKDRLPLQLLRPDIY